MWYKEWLINTEKDLVGVGGRCLTSHYKTVRREDVEK